MTLLVLDIPYLDFPNWRDLWFTGSFFGIDIVILQTLISHFLPGLCNICLHTNPFFSFAKIQNNNSPSYFERHSNT